MAILLNGVLDPGIRSFWFYVSSFVVQPIMTSPHLYTILFKEQTHIVVKGDTLYSISKFYGVSVEAIVKINKLESRHKILVGQTLKIPDANSKIGEAETRGSSETVPHIRTMIAPKEDATIDSVRMVQNSDHAGWERKQWENNNGNRPNDVRDSSQGNGWERKQWENNNGNYGSNNGSSSASDRDRNNGNYGNSSNSTRPSRYSPTRPGYKKGQNNNDFKDSPERSKSREYLYKSTELTVGPRTDIQLKVNQVRITKNSTMLTFVVKNLGNKSFPVRLARRNSKGAWYLTDRSFERNYKLKSIKNMDGWKQGRSFSLKSRGTKLFIAEFERIDNDVFYFHLLEGRGRKAGAWNIFDIGLGLNAGNGTDDQWDNRGYTEPESNEDIRDERDEKNYEEEYSTYYYVDREQEILDQTDPEVLDIIDRLDDRMRGARRSRESQRVRQNRGRDRVGDRVGDSVNSRRKNANSNASNRIREGYGNSRTGSVRNNQERGKRPYVYYYRVKKGDSLDTIAQRYGSTKNELLEINELESDELRIGKIIMVVRRD